MPTADDLRKAAGLLDDAEKIEAQIDEKRAAFEASVAELRQKRANIEKEVNRLTGTPSRSRSASNGSTPRAAVEPADENEVLKALTRLTKDGGKVSAADLAEEIASTATAVEGAILSLRDQGKAYGKTRGKGAGVSVKPI